MRMICNCDNEDKMADVQVSLEHTVIIIIIIIIIILYLSLCSGRLEIQGRVA